VTPVANWSPIGHDKPTCAAAAFAAAPCPFKTAYFPTPTVPAHHYFRLSATLDLPYSPTRDKILAANYNLIGGITMAKDSQLKPEELAMYFAKEVVRQRIGPSHSAKEIVRRFFEIYDELLTEFQEQNEIRQESKGGFVR
jgi:hypothetical protein